MRETPSTWLGLEKGTKNRVLTIYHRTFVSSIGYSINLMDERKEPQSASGSTK